MSFAFASYNEYGIVISADRCLTGNSEKGQQYISTSTSRKLFLTSQEYAITYTGCASVDGVPTPVLIQRVLSELNAESACFNLPELFERFTVKMSVLCKENIIFIAAGYQGGKPSILTATTQNPEIVHCANICYSGESKIGEVLLNMLPVTYQSMTLQDRIDFHRFINFTIAKFLFFSDKLPTVSPDCDIAVIGPNGVVFSEFSQLH